MTTYQSDALLRIDGDTPRIAHVEYESSSHLGRPRRFLRYNVLISEREDLVVDTVVILLRPQAESSDMVGEYREHGLSGEVKKYFKYDIIRVWEMPPEVFLAGGPGMWALAPLANVPETGLPRIMNELKDRWQTQSQPEMNDLMSITNVLMGLRYNTITVENLFRGVKGMEDSVTYQVIKNQGVRIGEQIGFTKGEQVGEQRGEQRGEQKGKIVMAHLSLISMLELKFGSVDPAIESAIRAINDDQRLTNMVQSVKKLNQPDDILNVQ